jgi:hypothetical protein
VETEENLLLGIDVRLALRNALWPLGGFERGLKYLRDAERVAGTGIRQAVRIARQQPYSVERGCAGLGGVLGRDAEWDAAAPALSELGGTSVLDHVGYLHHERRRHLDARGIHVSQVQNQDFFDV